MMLRVLLNDVNLLITVVVWLLYVGGSIEQEETIVKSPRNEHRPRKQVTAATGSQSVSASDLLVCI